jgi:hypothetical protein
VAEASRLAWGRSLADRPGDGRRQRLTGSDASVTPAWRYDSCKFWFRQSYVENATDRELDETIVHEWLHVSMRDLDSAIEAAEDQFSPAAREIWEARVLHEREAFIEHLARAIVDMYYVKH